MPGGELLHEPGRGDELDVHPVPCWYILHVAWEAQSALHSLLCWRVFDCHRPSAGILRQLPRWHVFDGHCTDFERYVHPLLARNVQRGCGVYRDMFIVLCWNLLDGFGDYGERAVHPMPGRHLLDKLGRKLEQHVSSVPSGKVLHGDRSADSNVRGLSSRGFFDWVWIRQQQHMLKLCCGHVLHRAWAHNQQRLHPVFIRSVLDASGIAEQRFVFAMRCRHLLDHSGGVRVGQLPILCRRNVFQRPRGDGDFRLQSVPGRGIFHCIGQYQQQYVHSLLCWLLLDHTWRELEQFVCLGHSRKVLCGHWSVEV